MTPEFRENIEALPSYFQTHFNGKEQFISRQSLYGIGNSLEELVLAEWEAGNVVSGSLRRDRKNGATELDVFPKDRKFFNSIKDFKIIDCGADGMYVWDRDSHKLKRSLLGEQPIPDSDVVHYFEACVKQHEELPLMGFSEDATIGTFMEQYQFGDSFLDIDDTSAAEDFFEDARPFLLDLEVYFELERFMRRKGFLKQEELLDPRVFFSDSTKRLIVAKQYETIYWNVYQEFIKIDPNSSDVLAVK